MNSYKEFWNKTYDELYNNFLDKGFSSSESAWRAQILTNTEAYNKYIEKADYLNQIRKENQS